MKSAKVILEDSLWSLMKSYRKYYFAPIVDKVDKGNAYGRAREIFFETAPETISCLLHNLKLADNTLIYEYHSVENTLLNFCRIENRLLIERSVNENYFKDYIEMLVEKITDLASEMKDCVNRLYVR